MYGSTSYSEAAFTFFLQTNINSLNWKLNALIKDGNLELRSTPLKIVFYQPEKIIA